MNGTTQVINFAASLLGPALRGRKVRSLADLCGLVTLVFTIMCGAVGPAAVATGDETRERLAYAGKCFAKIMATMLAFFDRLKNEISQMGLWSGIVSVDRLGLSVPHTSLAGLPTDADSSCWLGVS